MAELVFAFGSSHGPLLSIPPEEWDKRGDVDRKRSDISFRDGTYSFEKLAELRRSAYLLEQNRPEVRAASFQRCQVALDRLAEKFAQVRPDVLLIVGDDQHEWFQKAIQPAFAVVSGKEVFNKRFDPADYVTAAFGIEHSGREHRPPQDAMYPVETGVAAAIIDQAIRDEFDLTTCDGIPRDEKGPLCITHSVGFIVRRIMRDKLIPIVPILQNTFWAANRPRAGRCLDFGKSIARAVRAWSARNPGKRVAICASGGLSHYVVDEEWDQKILAAMHSGDEKTLREEPDEMFRSGTSETKNWITVCGALAGTGLKMKVVDYVPCYRTEAGTGNAMAFATWE